MSMIDDSQEMLTKYGVLDWVETAPPEKQRLLLNFRLAMLNEELQETFQAVENRDPEEVVDGLIDLMVIAIGTLNMFRVDVQRAWGEVHTANMNKDVGIKPSRPNPMGLPDLIKPNGWVSPSHANNHGLLTEIL